VRAATVSIFDNAFFRGRDRPTIHLRPGGVLTWRWSSQQSHQVMVRSGPKLLRSPAQADGAYSVRLEQPGTYQFVCAIHAPGMRMTAVVR
jgi:plastocyanin